MVFQVLLTDLGGGEGGLGGLWLQLWGFLCKFVNY